MKLTHLSKLPTLRVVPDHIPCLCAPTFPRENSFQLWSKNAHSWSGVYCSPNWRLQTARLMRPNWRLQTAHVWCHPTGDYRQHTSDATQLETTDSTSDATQLETTDSTSDATHATGDYRQHVWRHPTGDYRQHVWRHPTGDYRQHVWRHPTETTACLALPYNGDFRIW